ncbi:glycosyltransferase family 4 protein [Synechococcus lacustris]|uniref:Glycosyl transferase family 1 domain-containing protein n=1 Tax=Synechococcus lacustris str. Tous TaxID=1910958 RepID=A0A2P7EBQ9_9SYNE|nr:glycosyltransferase family 4 protein [Synechococcus lacustris]PSI00643.1 hypothetical protein C7K08_12060 [Synechococcus lacustris str. Tous]
MRIILVVIEEGRFAGPHRQAITLLEKLKFSNTSRYILLLPTSADEHLLEIVRDNDIEYRQVDLSTLSFAPRNLWHFFSSFFPSVRNLVGVYLGCNASVVLVFGGVWMVRSIIACMATKTPFVIRLNDTSQPFFFRMLLYFFTTFASGIIFNSRRTFSYYRDYVNVSHRLSSVLLPSCVDSSRFFPAYSRGLSTSHESRESFCRSRPLLLLSVGSIVPTKGFDRLVKICSLYARHDFPIVLTIAGPIRSNYKSYRDSLESMAVASSYFSLKLVHDSNDIASLYQSHDIYVCSSYHESSPNSVWEAMSCGLPVVSSDVGDVHDVIRRAGCGFCIDSVDFDGSFMSILDRVFPLGPGHLKLYGKQASDWVLTNNSPDAIARRFDSFLSKRI